MSSLLKSILKNRIKKKINTIVDNQPSTTNIEPNTQHISPNFSNLWQAAERENTAGNREKAKTYLYQALALEPGNAVLLCQLGSLENKMGLYDDAKDNLLTAIHLNPKLIEAYFEIGISCFNSKAFDEAIDYFEAGIEHAPNNPTLLCGLADIHVKKEQYASAIAIYEQAIQIAPNYAEAYNNLGNCYIKLLKLHEAIIPLKISQALDPENIKVYINLNYVYYSLGNLKKAYYYVYQGLKVAPNSETLHWVLAWSLLLFKRYQSGWIEYEYRFSDGGKVERRDFPFPLWQGENLNGKTIFIAAEQGLGDQIMFASCLPNLLAISSSCILECHEKLAPLLQQSFPEIQVINTQQKKEKYALKRLSMPIDYYTRIGSLPRWFRNSYESFLPARTYLSANTERIAFWKQHLSTLGNDLKVGISWRGGAEQTRSYLRTIPLSEWTSILKIPNVKFINLQYGDCQKELKEILDTQNIEIHHWPDAIEDYMETAALITSLDLVISVCTSAIHLSGALGQKTWVMVPASPEWRYLANAATLPWYPQVHLFRQLKLGHWQTVLSEVAQKLRDLNQKHPAQA
jgi:tetratricopeptide (TPR) repeat protein